jgi:signal transduction histidine kinase
MSRFSDVARRRNLYDIATVVFAVALGAYGALLAGGLLTKHPNTGVGPAIGVLFMTVVVAGVRRWPVGVAAAIAVAALGNGLIFGHVVRCGATLPAVFFVSYTVGARVLGRRSSAGLLLCLASVVAQCPYDPRLGWSALPFIGLVCVAFYGGGLAVKSRSKLVEDLRARNAELREQRSRSASMAVAADRAQVAGDLDEILAGRLATLADVAASGREAVGTPDATDALATIETTGRSTLSQMREVVGGLRTGDGTIEPPPRLADLPELARRTTGAAVEIRTDGDMKDLPAGIEGSAFRIVEHLLAVITDDPAARAELRVQAAADAVVVAISGPLAPDTDLTAVLAKVQARVSLHEGTVECSRQPGCCAVTVRLPMSVSVR